MPKKERGQSNKRFAFYFNRKIRSGVAVSVPFQPRLAVRRLPFRVKADKLECCDVEKPLRGKFQVRNDGQGKET